MLFIVLSVSFVIVTALGVFKFISLRRHIDALQDTLETPGHGLVFFDDKDIFFWANAQAQYFLPFLNSSGAQKFRKLNDFVNYMFDHAIDCDQSLKNTLTKSARGFSDQGFREVFQWKDNRFCLGELQRTKQKRSVLILRDISNLKKEEENLIRLRKYNYELSEAIEATDNGVIIVDIFSERCPVLFVNNALCRYLSCEKQNVLGQSIQFVFHNIGDDTQVQRIVQSFQEDELDDLEFNIVLNDQVRWFDLKLSGMSPSSEAQGLVIGVFTETTALKLKEAEFFQAQKLEALGKLAAGVAHDFNNVLSIIDGYSRIVEKELEDRPKVRAYVERVRSAAQRGAGLTRQMLTFSRHKIVSNSIVDLAEFVPAQEALIKPLMDASVRVSIDVRDPNLFVKCPEDNIAQILMNLCVNACHAMESGGEINIQVFLSPYISLPASVADKALDDDYVCISVVDNGSGIEDGVLERMFDPFFTTKGQGKGTGLGLSMVYGLVQQLSGYIDVQTSLGKGTNISIYFPLSECGNDRVVSGTLEQVEDINLKGFTVLVADDEEDLLLIVEQMLQQLGMNVMTACDGNEALVRQDDYEGKIDFLLTDVIMPGLDGLRLSQMIAELRPETKTIFMSGYPASGGMAKMDLPDNACFMAKPIEYEALAKIMYELATQTFSTVQGKGPETFAPRWDVSKQENQGGGDEHTGD